MQKNQVAYIGLNNLFGRIVTSLLKQSPNISKLVLYDDKNGGTVQSYTNGPEEECNVTTIYGRERLPLALTKADIVVIGDELFQTPSPESITSIGHKAAEYARLIATFSPNAILVIAAYPLNYVLPIFARVLEAAGCFDPKRLLGATSCDTLRASTLLSSRLRLSPQKTILPVIGGASSTTRIPLFSQANSPIEIDQDTKNDVIDKLKLFDGTEYSEADVIERAYASVRFTHSVLAARRGVTSIPEIALTRNEEIPNVEYCSMPLLIGKDGVEKIMKLPKLSSFESDMLQSAIECLNADISASKYILNEKNTSDVQDLGVQIRIIEGNEEQSCEKQYDIPNQELQDKPKDFMELDSVFTGVSDTVRNDIYEDTVKNEENVKINLPSMEEIHRVTTTFVMPHERNSKRLNGKTPAVSSSNMNEKVEDVDLMINNILPKNNGLPFNKVTLSQIKKDIGFTKTEVYPDSLTYRRKGGFSKFVANENKSVTSFIFKPKPPTKRVYNYIKKSKKEANFLPEKSIIEKHVQTEGPFRTSQLPVKLKITKTGTKLAKSKTTEEKIDKPISFNVPIQEEQDGELGNTIYPLDIPKLITVENPGAYVDSVNNDKSLVPFENKNQVSIDSSSIESDFENFQKDYEIFDINGPKIIQSANKQMLSNQGIIEGEVATSQDPEDRINALAVRDMAKRFAKLEQAVQKVLSMSQNPKLEAGKTKPKSTEKFLSASENQMSNSPDCQNEETTQNIIYLFSPQKEERAILDSPKQLVSRPTLPIHQECLNTENQMESQFAKTQISEDEDAKTEHKEANQFYATQEELGETGQMVNQNSLVEAKEESSVIPEQVTSQELPKIPGIVIRKSEQVVINESTTQQEPPVEDKNLSLAMNVQTKIGQLVDTSQQESTNFSQFVTALDQIIETAPKSLPGDTVKPKETKAQSSLNIKKITVIKLNEPKTEHTPKIPKLDFFKELNDRFELEKRLSEKNSKMKSIPEVQNVSEPKKSNVNSPNLVSKLNENLEKNEEENNPDSFLLFKKSFDHVLSTASRSVNLTENSKKELQNNPPSEVTKTSLHKSFTIKNIEKEMTALIHRLKKNKDCAEADKILRKLYSELSEEMKTKNQKSSSILNMEDVGEKSVRTFKKTTESIEKPLSSDLPKLELTTKLIEANKKLEIDLKSSLIPSDNKGKDNLELKNYIINNIKKNNLEVYNKIEQIKKESEKIKDGKIKIILAPKSKLKEQVTQENESKEVNTNIIEGTIDIKGIELKEKAAKLNESKEVNTNKIILGMADKKEIELKEKATQVNEIKEVNTKKIILGMADKELKEKTTQVNESKEANTNKIILGTADKKEIISIGFKADKMQLAPDAQHKEIRTLKEDTKAKIILVSTSSVLSKDELSVNPLGLRCKETTLLNLNIPLNQSKVVKTERLPDETSKEKLLATNPSVKEDSSNNIIKRDIPETSSASEEGKTESLKTKIARHRNRRRPKFGAKLRVSEHYNNKFKMVKLQVKRNRLKSKTSHKPKMATTEESKDVNGIKVPTPKTTLITKPSKKLANAMSMNRRNNSENDYGLKKIVRSLKAKPSLAKKDMKVDEASLQLNADNPVSQFLAKALEKKKLRDAARLTLKASSSRDRKQLTKDSLKPYGFSLPSENKSGPPKNEIIIAEKKRSRYTNSKKITTKSERKEEIRLKESIKISLISNAKTEKPDHSIMKNTESKGLKIIELKKSDEKNTNKEKLKSDILNLKISISDPFPKNEKNETEICLVGSDAPFPDWSPIADDCIPITGEIVPSNDSIENIKAELDTKLIEEMKKPIDLLITPKSQVSPEPKKIAPLNSNPENKLSTMKLELTKAAVKAHSLNKPREKKISAKNTFIAWETNNNTLKATKVKENLVPKQKLNERSHLTKKTMSNEAKVVKSASMLALREAKIKIGNSPSPKSSKSLANIAASLKQAVDYVESNTTAARKTKSAHNFRSDTKVKQPKFNLNVSGEKKVKITPKPDILINKKKDDKITITTSEKPPKNKKYEYNIVKRGIKKVTVEDGFNSKNIHTQSELQAKQDEVNKEIKGIVDLRNKKRSESPSNNTAVVDIAQKSLNEFLKNAILLNAKVVTKDVFANRKIDTTKIEQKLSAKQDKKENPVLKNKASSPVSEKISIKPPVETTTEKKPKFENLTEFLNEGKQMFKLPTIKPPELMKSELNVIPDRKLNIKNYEALLNLEEKEIRDTERKRSGKGKSKYEERKSPVESTSNMPEKHPFIKKIEHNNRKKKPPPKSLDRKTSRTQELLNTTIEIKPSSINVHGPLSQKNIKPANSILLPPRSSSQTRPPPQIMKLNPGKKANKRNDMEYFKDFNEPRAQQMKPHKIYSKTENIKKNSIYQTLSNSSQEKLNAAQTPSSLKSAPHPIVPKKPVRQQSTKKIVAVQHEIPKPIITGIKENKNPWMKRQEKIIDRPPGNPNIVTIPEASANTSKKDGWGRLFNVFKQIISKDLEEEHGERMRAIAQATRSSNLETTK